MKPQLVAEVAVLTVLAAVAGASLALQAGAWSWTWDGLNHHVYLGMLAEQARWHLDVLAADTQGYQYPYLYWPVYRIALLDGNGLATAMVWAGAQSALLLPPVWLLAHRLLGERPSTVWEPPLARLAACVLAYLNAVVLLGLGMSANDLLAACPLLWAVALYLGRPDSTTRLFWCSALFGISVAFKFSNGIMLPLLAIWWLGQMAPLRSMLRRAAGFGIGASVGFVVAYLPWGLQLWRATGNPFYPFLRVWFGGY